MIRLTVRKPRRLKETRQRVESRDVKQVRAAVARRDEEAVLREEEEVQKQEKNVRRQKRMS